MDQRFIKGQIRAWLQKRQLNPAPLPSMDRIQLDVGWKGKSLVQETASGTKAHVTSDEELCR